MSFKFKCPYCQTKLEAEDEWANMQLECPNCKNSVVAKPDSEKINIPLGKPVNKQPGNTGFPNQQQQQAFNYQQPQQAFNNQQPQQAFNYQQPPPAFNYQQPQQAFNNQYSSAVRTEKNPAVALILNFLLPGVGQIYNGQAVKGIVLIILDFICIAMAILCCIGFIFLPILWIISIIDAYKLAERVNSGRKLREFEMFWNK